jgi:hypothetical protein
MKLPRLTGRPGLAKHARMASIGSGGGAAGGWCRRAWTAPVVLLAVFVTVGAALSACVSVNAPDKPIVIELNINIKQEVIYRLAADANATIESNPGIF